MTVMSRAYHGRTTVVIVVSSFLLLSCSAWRRAQVTGSAPAPRALSKMFFMDGHLWIFGGHGSNPSKGDRIRFNDMWRCHQSLNDVLSWERVPVTDPWPAARGYPAVVWTGSKLFMFGGQMPGARLNEFVDEAWLFDARSVRWTSVSKTTPWPGSRYGGRGIVLRIQDEEWIYMVGGEEKYELGLDRCKDMWRFNTARQIWEIIPWESDWPVFWKWPYTDIAFVGSTMNELYVFGTSFKPHEGLEYTWAFNPLTRRWRRISTGDYRPRNFGAAAVTQTDGKLIVYGGYRGPEVGGRYSDYSDEMWMFDFATDRWGRISQGGPAPARRMSSASAVAGTTYALFGGLGTSRNAFYNDLWMLDLQGISK